MGSLFSDLKGSFKADIQGRYLGFIFREVCRYDPEIIPCLFPGLGLEDRALNARIRVDREYQLVGVNRKADIVLFLDDKLTALIEIKVEDQFGHTNPRQMSD